MDTHCEQALTPAYLTPYLKYRRWDTLTGAEEGEEEDVPGNDKHRLLTLSISTSTT